MEVVLSPHNILLLIGIIIGCYQILVIAMIGGQDTANKFLVSALVFSILLLSEYFLVLSNGYLQFPHLIGVGNVLLLGIGPSLYFYAHLTLTNQPFKTWEWIHYAPILLMLINSYDVISLSGAEKIEFIRQFWLQPTPFSWHYLLFLSLFLSQMGIYLYVIYSLTQKSYTQKTQYDANTHLLRLRWINILLLIFIVFLASFLLVYISWSLRSVYTLELESILMVILSMFIFILAYYSVGTSNVISSTKVPLPPSQTTLDKKYKSSALTDELTQTYLASLLAHMDTQKPYLNPELKLQDLATQLNIPSHQLSQIINEQLKLHFFDFINGYRVKEAKNRLIDPQHKHLTILGIGLEAGFSNKGSFNRIFKKFTNTTPTEYIKQQNIAENI